MALALTWRNHSYCNYTHNDYILVEMNKGDSQLCSATFYTNVSGQKKTGNALAAWRAAKRWRSHERSETRKGAAAKPQRPNKFDC